jgi:hypothetical protein
LKFHQEALDLGHSFSRFDPGHYCADRYVPHISIFDRLSLHPTKLARMVAPWRWNDSPVLLSGVHVMAELLDQR